MANGVQYENLTDFSNLEHVHSMVTNQNETSAVLQVLPEHSFVCGQCVGADNSFFTHMTVISFWLVTIDCLTSTNVTDDQLNQLNAKITIDYHETFSRNTNDHIFALQNGPKFRLVQSFGDKVIRLKLENFPWSVESVASIEHALITCRNLVRLDMKPIDQQIDHTMWNRLMGSLGTLFNNPDRALKLRNLAVRGEIHANVLNGIFENCLNLDSSDIDSCPQLTNDHLIKWAQNGAKLINFEITKCDNITCDGLCCVLINGGIRLEEFQINQTLDKPTRRVLWQTLRDYCPNLKRAKGIGSCEKGLASKFDCPPRSALHDPVDMADFGASVREFLHNVDVEQFLGLR